MELDYNDKDVDGQDEITTTRTTRTTKTKTRTTTRNTEENKVGSYFRRNNDSSIKRKNRDYYIDDDYDNKTENEMMDVDVTSSLLSNERQELQKQRNGNANTSQCDTVVVTENGRSNNSMNKDEEPRLERYGQWLLSVPRDDVCALQRTPEYASFVRAFKELEKAHLVLHKSTKPKSQQQQQQQQQTSSITQQRHQRQMSRKERNNNDSNMQLGGLLVDDVILRIFEFLNCKSLVPLSQTCHRLRMLAQLSARQQTSAEPFTAMKLLRAKEQSRGIDPTTPPFVQIPILGLPRRVYVHGASDNELNGIYFCTGTNGNGYLFTKPRYNTTTIYTAQSTQNNTNTNHNTYHPNNINHPTNTNNNNNANFETMNIRTTLNPANITIHHRLDHNPPPQPHPQLFHHHHHDHNNNPQRMIPNLQPNNNQRQLLPQQPQPNKQQSNNNNNLRCIIAKRFSNETLLWYLSKEDENNDNGMITQVFSFWARLMLIGDAEPELCGYPSMTSVLSRNGDPAWQPLTTTRTMTPPCVELLD